MFELADKTVQFNQRASNSNDLVGAYVARARLQAALGRREEALADFEKAGHLTPTFGDPDSVLSSLRWEPNGKLFRLALRVPPSGGPDRSPAARNRLKAVLRTPPPEGGTTNTRPVSHCDQAEPSPKQESSGRNGLRARRHAGNHSSADLRSEET
jgi:tetratricopeptide (TPR) repeat protein